MEGGGVITYILNKEGGSLAIYMVWGGPYRNFDLSNIFFPPPLYINNDRSLNSSQTDKALSVKTSNADFVIFFAYFGNSLFDYL